MDAPDSLPMFLELCRRILKNDRSAKALTLSEPCLTHLGWDHCRTLSSSLWSNNTVEKLVLSIGKGEFVSSPENALLLSTFLSASPSLKHVCVGRSTRSSEKLGSNGTVVSILLDSMSRSSSLLTLNLVDVHFGDNHQHFLEVLLSKTKSLKILHIRNPRPASTAFAKLVGSGLAMNSTIEQLKVETTAGLGRCLPLVYILRGIREHPKLENLALPVHEVSKTAQHELAVFLRVNGTLQVLEPWNPVPLKQIVYGLERNKGLKEIIMGPGVWKTSRNADCWTRALARHRSLEKLVFPSGSVLCADHTSAIAKGMCDNDTVGILEFNGCFVWGQVWQTMLEKNTTIRVLKLRRCSLDGQMALYLARGLSCNTSLETVDLSYNHIGDNGVGAIAEALATKNGGDAVRELNLRETLAGPRCCVALKYLLANTQFLVVLDLSRNPLTRTGCEIIAQGLTKNKTLQKLIMAETDASNTGCVSVCEGLRRHDCINTLDMARNGIHLDAIIAAGLREVISSTPLRNLKLSGNVSTREGMLPISESLFVPRVCLQELDLSHTGLDDECLRLLAGALTHSTSMTKLRISHRDDEPHFTDQGISDFFAFLPRMYSLRYLEGINPVDFIYIVPENVSGILVASLRDNVSLHKIDVLSVPDEGQQWEVDFCLRLNRFGRRFLQPGIRVGTGGALTDGLWPHVLARMTAPRYRSDLHYFLTRKPNLVKQASDGGRGGSREQSVAPMEEDGGDVAPTTLE